MASSPPSRLTPLQSELLSGFFAHEKRFFLTGGAALAGFYFGHRGTDDLDFFSAPGPDLADAARAVDAAATACGATATPERTYADFRRIVARRRDEECVVDLVIDRAPSVDPDKARFGDIVVDTKREIAANKICALLSRSEIKDLLDLQVLVSSGIDLHRAFEDASKKDASADPATLSWVLGDLAIGPEARLPSGADPVALERFRADFVRLLRSEAFTIARGGTKTSE